MDQRIEFALRARNCQNFSELCREFGISRKAGYKWVERFTLGGIEGMDEQSRRPESHPAELPERVVCEMVALKLGHPNWGARKIRELYARKNGKKELPCESSFKRVLARAGLVRPRRVKRAKESGRIASGRRAEAPNEVWTVDFKGWWYGAGGGRIEPLTVRDEYSRMILELRAVADARTETVRACFERLFEAHGLPGAIRSDNGPPFACVQGLLGLTRLSAWWLALGIDLERGRPGCPQDNGAHERMHLDVARELERGKKTGEQEALEMWRREFNVERPHEALGMACPAEVYRPSERPYEGTPDEIDYGGRETRRVNARTGYIRFGNELVFISAALGGWNLGLSPREDGLVEVWFARLPIGHLDPRTSSFQPARPAPPPPAPTGLSADSATLHRPKGRSASRPETPLPAMQP